MKLFDRSDPEFVRQVQQEQYSQQMKVKPRVVKLPCNCCSVQVDKPSTDMIALMCPKCHKTHYLIWSALERHKWRK